jgi:hypothetical protein
MSDSEIDIERTWVEYEVKPTGISISFYEEYPNGETGLRDERWLTSAEARLAFNKTTGTVHSGTLE